MSLAGVEGESDGVDAVILAGGMGSRLRSVIGARQKVAVPIDGRTTLDRLLTHLEASRRVRRAVVCAGFDAEAVHDAVAGWDGALEVHVVREAQPLGTGGALRAALDTVRGDTFLVLNGDSYLPVHVGALLALHEAREAEVTLAAAHVADARRFGRLEFGDDGSVARFVEKGDDARGEAWINGGVYVVERRVVTAMPFGAVRSLERDVLSTLAGTGRLWAVRWPGPFLDVGTPESLAAASDFFGHAEDRSTHQASDVLVVLDRDGTLIEEKHYLSEPAAVVLVPGAAEAVCSLKRLPGVVAVMSNQAGVGRGFFGEGAVAAVNARVRELLRAGGCDVDAMYYCPHAPDAHCACRKPARGMVDQALAELAIAPRQIYVIGDNYGDVQLAEAVGGWGILVRTGHGARVQRDPAANADFLVRDLPEAAALVQSLVRQEAWQRALASARPAPMDADPVSAPVTC